MARSIVFGQGIEIGRMIQLLRDFGESEVNEGDTSMAWMGHPVPLGEMPGMATDAELDELGAASGAEADNLYVDLMVRHHEGGIEMAEYAAANASDDEVRAMANVDRHQPARGDHRARAARRLTARAAASHTLSGCGAARVSGWRTPAYTPGVRRRSPRRVIVAMSAAVGLTLAACGVDVDVSTSRADTLSTEDPAPPDTTDATDDTTDDTRPTTPARPVHRSDRRRRRRWNR